MGYCSVKHYIVLNKVILAPTVGHIIYIQASSKCPCPITYLKTFVSKEVYFFEVFIYNMVQTECLVPAFWKYIKADLATYTEMQVVLSKLFV